MRNAEGRAPDQGFPLPGDGATRTRVRGRGLRMSDIPSRLPCPDILGNRDRWTGRPDGRHPPVGSIRDRQIGATRPEFQGRIQWMTAVQPTPAQGEDGATRLTCGQRMAGLQPSRIPKRGPGQPGTIFRIGLMDAHAFRRPPVRGPGETLIPSTGENLRAPYARRIPSYRSKGATRSTGCEDPDPGGPGERISGKPDISIQEALWRRRRPRRTRGNPELERKPPVDVRSLV